MIRPITLRWIALVFNAGNAAWNVASGAAFWALISGLTLGGLISIHVWAHFQERARP